MEIYNFIFHNINDQGLALAWAWVAPLIAAGASAAGQAMTNRANQREAEANREFQADMSNTAHQREVADLRKAGLNPILSVNKGASTLGGAQATLQNAVGEGVSSAIEARRLSKEIQAVDSQVALNQAQATAQQAAANRDTTSAKQTAVATEILKNTGAADIAESKARIKHAGYDNEAAGYDAIMKRAESLSNIVPKIRIKGGDNISPTERKYLNMRRNYDSGRYPKGPR